MLASPCDVGGSDRDLLLAGRAATLAVNRANAARWAALLAFFARKLAGQKKRKAQNPQAPLTARQETVIEVGELCGIGAGALRKELNAAIFLTERMPSVMSLVQSGALDAYRARLIADAFRGQAHQDDDSPLDNVDQRISKFLLKHLRFVDSVEVALTDSGDGSRIFHSRPNGGTDALVA